MATRRSHPSLMPTILAAALIATLPCQLDFGHGFGFASAMAGNGHGNGGNGGGNGNAGGNGNGGGNGNAGANSNAGGNGNAGVNNNAGGNGNGATASALGALNAAHASAQALENASPNSEVGKIATYSADLNTFLSSCPACDTSQLTQIGDDLAAAANKTVTSDSLNTLNGLLGVSDPSLVDGNWAADSQTIIDQANGQ